MVTITITWCSITGKSTHNRTSIEKSYEGYDVIFNMTESWFLFTIRILFSSSSFVHELKLKSWSVCASMQAVKCTLHSVRKQRKAKIIWICGLNWTDKFEKHTLDLTWISIPNKTNWIWATVYRFCECVCYEYRNSKSNF